jgi:hypothetical protein
VVVAVVVVLLLVRGVNTYSRSDTGGMGDGTSMMGMLAALFSILLFIFLLFVAVLFDKD